MRASFVPYYNIKQTQWLSIETPLILIDAFLVVICGFYEHRNESIRCQLPFIRSSGARATNVFPTLL